MFNQSDYDFEELELPNILFARNRSATTPVPVVTHPFLLPLITKLAMAKPKWRLIADQCSYRSDKPEWATRFYVIEDGQDMGTIKKGYSYSSNTDEFMIDNSRMAKKRQRGAETRTKSVDRAYKIVTKEFYPKTTEELLSESTQQMGALIRGEQNKRSYAYQACSQKVFAFTRPFIDSNWASYEEFMLGEGMKPEDIQGYHTSLGAMEATQSVHDAFHDGTGCTVIVRAMDYLICNKEGAKTYTQSELPTPLRTKIGMLQLVDDNSVVPHVGARVSANTMYVVMEKEDE